MGTSASNASEASWVVEQVERRTRAVKFAAIACRDCHSVLTEANREVTKIRAPNYDPQHLAAGLYTAITQGRLSGRPIAVACHSDLPPAQRGNARHHPGLYTFSQSGLRPYSHRNRYSRYDRQGLHALRHLTWQPPRAVSLDRNVVQLPAGTGRAE